MYTNLPSAGPSFLVHLAVVLALVLTWPVMRLIAALRREEERVA